MKPAPFDYFRPQTLAEATSLLAEAAGAAQIIAGGQTLMPLLALRMSQPLVLVDVARVPDLQQVCIDTATVRIGAALTQNALITNPQIAEALPLLVTAAKHVGHHQTRNRGTVGGSVALGEPAAELPATMVALNATLELASTRGTRRVPAREFYLGPYASVAEPGEVLTVVEVPRWPADAVPVFRELARRPGDFALAGFTGMLALEGGSIARAGLAWFAMGPTPVAATGLEQALVGQPASLDPAAFADAALTGTAPFDDSHASAEYRRTVGRRLFTRALGEALQQRTAA